MTYDADNRLLTYNGQSVQYDACGNMTKGPLNGGMAEFTYDCRNRLVKVKEEDGRTTVYEYDAEDIRTASVTGGVRTEYITDRETVYSQVLVKTSYGKNVFGVYNEERERITYTYGAGLINERRDGGEEYIYHYNHLGSAVAITDGNGEIAFRIVYGTYGELYDIRNAGGVSLLTAETAEGCTAAEVGYALGMEYLYNGQYGVSTGGNGLYYMRARYYDQDIKRFINRDILSGNIGNSQSLNRYCYVQGNPVSLTDPFGLCPTRAEVYKNRALRWLHTALDVGGILFDGFDYVNVLLYHFEGRDTEAAITLLCLLPVMGNFLALPVRLTLKLGSNAGEALVKLGKKYLPNLMENGSRFLNWAGGKIDDVWRWIQKKLGKVITLKHKATSGVPLVSTPGKTTTILGRYKDDTQYIIKELGIGKNTDFSGNPGGFNLLNTPDELFEQLGPDGFWEKYNKPFLDAAISRGDEILMATPITKNNLYISGTDIYTGYGREYYYLVEHGYEYINGRMIFKGVN